MKTKFGKFVRPVLEYAPLASDGAAPTHLTQLDWVQRRALHIIGYGPASRPQTLE